MIAAPVSIALVHHPVRDKNGQLITSAVTNLDIHDIARSAVTYGLSRYYVVTPAVEQQLLTERICRHWREGWGAGYNPKRKAALDLVRVAADLEEVRADLAADGRPPVKIIVTGARERGECISCSEMRSRFADPLQHYVIVFGTAWGLTDEVFAAADFILEPIRGAGQYNHLSVRAAAAIYFDRLFGRE